MKILVINGANLNMLGKREPSIYGSKTSQDLYNLVADFCGKNEIKVEFFCSNNEGDIVTKLQFNNADGIVLNAGAFTHYSYAIADAIKCNNTPVVEVHISDVNQRESFRQNSVIKPNCIATICGKGFDGYLEAINILLNK
ncbi:MAG: type II 3-dehydroquinate dehydratase [Clostridia bacterium]